MKPAYDVTQRADPDDDVGAWFRNQGVSRQALDVALRETNRVQIERTPDLYYLRDLKQFILRENLRCDRDFERVYRKYEEELQDQRRRLDQDWANTIYDVFYAGALPATITLDWAALREQGTWDAIRRIVIALRPCVKRCKAEKHPHYKHARPGTDKVRKSTSGQTRRSKRTSNGSDLTPVDPRPERQVGKVETSETVVVKSVETV